MKELKGSERKQLRAMAHGLEPVCYVGKNGLTAEFLDSVRVALADHELIKVKFIDGKGQRKAWSARIAAATDSNLVGLIGHVAILYRKQPDEEKRRIRL
ncbi:MAG TPA: YhbY family RNA-binding protein [Candidatus Bathyarchaeia archaeon]|nr:YhbY family RNA-binding protein [Candidatus Bathyarchaeia archaeon]